MDFDIFLSYNWDIKDIVQSFYQKLTEDFNFKVWIDDEQLSNQDLFQGIADGIKKSKVFVSFLTKKYSESTNCNREFTWALTLKKPMVVLMIERVDIADLGQVGFLANPLTRFNIYNDINNFKNGKSKEFSSAINAITSQVKKNRKF